MSAFFSVLMSNKASLVSSLQLSTERGCRMVMTRLRQRARVRSSKPRRRVGSSKMIGGSRKANEDKIGEKTKPAVGLPVSSRRQLLVRDPSKVCLLFL